MATKKTPVESARFDGFASLKFFRDLAKHQSREWFAAHKAEYDEGFAKPMAALLAEAKVALDRAYPDCELDEPKVFRIHRDVRFAKDKSPYKTHIAGVLTVRTGTREMMATPAALYVHVGFDPATKKDDREAGAGLYMMSGEQLARHRAAVLDAKKGKQLAGILAKLEKAGMRFIAGESTKKPPRGVDPEHPRAELLKLKGLVAMFPLDAAALSGRGLLDVVVAQGRTVAPLVRWLTHEVR